MLSTKTTKELEAMYQEMQPVLEHNLTTLQLLTVKDFQQIFNYKNYE